MAAPLRVLHLVNRWESGGVQRHILDLTAALRARGCVVRIAGWIPRGEASPGDIVGLPLYSADGTRKSATGFLSSIGALRRLLKRERIELLHMHSRYVTAAGACAVLGTSAARVYTAHSAFRDLGALPWYPRDIICPGTAVRDAFLETVRGVERHRLHVVPHGVRLPEEDVAADVPADVPERPFFLFLGRLVAGKGGEVLIDALAELRAQTRASWSALFVGDGPCREEWRVRAASRGIADVVRFAGHRSDPRPYLAGARALVMPSTSLEGLPMAMLEAMAAKCPVISSDLAPFREIIENGVTGLIFRNRDATQLAAALRAALEDAPRLAAIAERALRMVVERHSVADMTSRTAAVYETAMRRGG